MIGMHTKERGNKNGGGEVEKKSYDSGMTTEEYGSEFPGRLRKLRERRRMNQKALGECCGVSKNTVARWERGEVEPAMRSLIEIADFFEVSTDYLLGRQNFL